MQLRNKNCSKEAIRIERGVCVQCREIGRGHLGEVVDADEIIVFIDIFLILVIVTVVIETYSSVITSLKQYGNDRD